MDGWNDDEDDDYDDDYEENGETVYEAWKVQNRIQILIFFFHVREQQINLF